jgi:hypothetical protein
MSEYKKKKTRSSKSRRVREREREILEGNLWNFRGNVMSTIALMNIHVCKIKMIVRKKRKSGGGRGSEGGC